MVSSLFHAYSYSPTGKVASKQFDNGSTEDFSHGDPVDIANLS